jgi:hypothetical protein
LPDPARGGGLPTREEEEEEEERAFLKQKQNKIKWHIMPCFTASGLRFRGHEFIDMLNANSHSAQTVAKTVAMPQLATREPVLWYLLMERYFGRSQLYSRT